MAVVQANDELLEDPARLLLRQAPVRPVPQRVVEQVAALRILHRYGQVRLRQEHLPRTRQCTPARPQLGPRLIELFFAWYDGRRYT